MSQQKPTTAETVRMFNERFPVGATVRWRSIASDKSRYREYTVSHTARDHHGQPVAWFAERSGFVSVSPDFVDYSLDWETAFKHFADIRNQYRALAGSPGVNTSLALEAVFRPLAERFERGERSFELFKQMSEVE